MAWAYRVAQERKRHRRGYFADFWTVKRSDGKVVCDRAYDEKHAERIKARFETWARQPWR